MSLSTDTSERRRFITGRRLDDGVLLTLIGLVLTAGIAWGTATATMTSKVDKVEFISHRGEVNQRLQLDSLNRIMDAAALRRIEDKVDAGNARISKFICDKQPSYCQ